MERIKQALEKARADREASGDAVAGNARATARRPSVSGDGAIVYQQTRIVSLDPKILKRNRVISGDTDLQGIAAYKLLRTQVLNRMAARNFSTLGITSPSAGDGKTLTAINLAISLARELHYTVLLVDADLRNPTVHKYLGIEPAKGIYDALANNVPLEEVLINPGIERLVILPGRGHVENSSEILASPGMGEFVTEIKNRYPARIVLFDLPPVLMADDALAFAAHADSFLMVLRDGATGRDELEQAMEIMKDTTMIGTVLNAAKEPVSGYY